MKIMPLNDILSMVSGTQDERLYDAESGKKYFVNISAKDHAEPLISESHDFEDDIYMVLEGAADLYLGGEIVEKREVSEGQWRGETLTEDAKMQRISAGDMVFIPATTPHMLDARNDKIKLAIVKIIE